MAANSTDQVYACLCDRVILGELPSGVRLSEEKFARELGVSRTPVREAVKRLVNEGVFEQVPRSGTYVRRLGRRDIEELFDLREFFEGYAAYHAASLISANQLDELKRLCDSQYEYCLLLRDGTVTDNDHKRAILGDVAFHLLILHAAGSERVVKMVGELRLLTNLCGRQWVLPVAHRALMHCRTWATHLRIWQALQRRDADSARVRITEHIRGAKAGVLRAYDAYEHRSDRVSDLPDSVRAVIERMERFTVDRTRR